MGWIADVTPGEPISSTAYGNIIRDRVVQVFDSNAERNATAVPRIGMVAFTNTEFELAVYLDSWVVLSEMWHPWEPTVMLGTVPLGITTNHGSWYRRQFGAVEIKLQVTVHAYELAVAEDVLHVVPPYAPVNTGDFGVATASRPDAGTFGPVGAYDPTQLAIIKMGGDTGTAAIVTWDDLTPGSGQITVTMSGSYITGQIST